MKKKIFLTVLFFLLLSLCFVSYAGTDHGASELEDLVPSDVSEYAPDRENVENFLEIGNVFSVIISLIGSVLSKKISGFIACTVILVILYVLSSVSQDPDDPLMKTLSVIAVFGTVLSSFVSVSDMTGSLCGSLDDVCSFGGSFLSVLFGIASASGKTVSSAGTAAVAGTLFSGLYFVSSELVMPCVCTYYAVGISSSVLGNGGLRSLASAFRNFCISLICACSFVFTLVLTAKNILSSGADSVSAKGIAYVVGRSVPIIGSNIGESVSSVLSGLDILGKNVGVFGCVIIFLILLRPIIEAAVMLGLTSLLGAVSSLLGLLRMKDFFDTVKNVYYILLALSFGAGVLLIITSGTVMR